MSQSQYCKRDVIESVVAKLRSCLEHHLDETPVDWLKAEIDVSVLKSQIAVRITIGESGKIERVAPGG